jgi:hypothetical protein
MQKQKQYLSLVAAVALLMGIALQALPMHRVSAAQITNRSLTLQAGTVGGSAPGDANPAHTVNHLFAFSIPSTSNIQSIQFQYCTTAADVGAATCVMPTGLVTTAATMGSETGITGWTLNNTTNGAPYLTRAAVIAPTANQAVTEQLLGIQNPTTANQTFFVRIATFGSANATGSPTDTGTVAASTTNQIQLSGTMPESLVFCTGMTVGTTAGVPDCTTATGGAVAFNQLFSPTDTAIAESQMASSTNAGSGYAITINGPTLTSGSNTIAALALPTASVKGTAQFGVNLRANTVAAASSFPGTISPFISADIAAASNPTNLRGEPLTGYNTADTFTFVSGNTVADSGYTAGGPGSPVASDAQIFTASYIVNVPGSQAAGTYTTTLTYICTPTF